MTRDGLSLDDLRLVQAIATAGSLTGAARQLSIDHSTAFRRLGAIEARTGTSLFERARDGYAPTPAGEAAVTAARRILADLAALEQRLAGEDLRPSGTVRLTTTDTLVELVTPSSPRFGRAPGGHRRPRGGERLPTKRDADIALRPAAAAPEGLVGWRLAALATAPYASPS